MEVKEKWNMDNAIKKYPIRTHFVRVESERGLTIAADFKTNDHV